LDRIEDMRRPLKCEFIDDEIGTDQVSIDGIRIESRSHRKDSVMDKKVDFPTVLSAQWNVCFFLPCPLCMLCRGNRNLSSTTPSAFKCSWWGAWPKFLQAGLAASDALRFWKPTIQSSDGDSPEKLQST
jgi:hypothetical protein